MLTVEFMLAVTELIGIQEKTNYPTGSLTESLYKDFGKKTVFQLFKRLYGKVENKNRKQYVFEGTYCQRFENKQ